MVQKSFVSPLYFCVQTLKIAPCKDMKIHLANNFSKMNFKSTFLLTCHRKV